MTDLRVYRAGDGYVIDSDEAAFWALVGLVRGNHLVSESSRRENSAEWLTELRSTMDRIAARMPSGKTYRNMDAMIEAQNIDGVDFVGVSTRIVVGVREHILEWIADCLERVVVRGDDPDLQTIIGAWFPEIRTMYLIVSGALGKQGHARQVAFGEGG